MTRSQGSTQSIPAVSVCNVPYMLLIPPRLRPRPCPLRIHHLPRRPPEVTVPASAPNTVPTPSPAGAGLPAPLIAPLRGADGPFLANEVFGVPPSEPLAAVEETVAAPEWYAITHGRFVGVVDQFALSTVAITGIAHSARKAYTTQALALDAFNRALTLGSVQVA
ncbi:hypothetical protein C8R45DRAFT_1097567 [Mycena sanguinolenta]|nr:hypothetical protein C8R45DRAFT_1097567 [Mycena sanguinolenta]